MFKNPLAGVLMAASIVLLAACSRTPYAPTSATTEPLNATMYAPKVESFVVLLDTSGSMKQDYDGRTKIHSAQDLVASFNTAVPPLDFQSGLVTFGKGSSSCIGYGVATTIYGMASYQSADFADALGSIKCAASTTPIADALDTTTGLLDTETGPAAVIIVSDFKWKDPATVQNAVDALKAAHGSNVCLHTVKIGDDTSNDALIANIINSAGCDSAVNAGDIASAAAMSTYVADTLMGPLQYEKHTVSATALFEFDKSILKEAGKAELHNLGEYIKSQGMSVGDIDVIGHTDSVGSAGYNQRLSVRRATAVRDYLVSEGIDSAIVDVSGMGEADPLASNETDAGRAQNRRVEIHVGTSRPSK